MDDVTAISSDLLRPDETPRNLTNSAFTYDDRRDLIEAERFARPPLPVTTPALVQHLVFHGGDVDVATARQACLAICRRLKVTPLDDLPDQMTAAAGDLTLKWEQHTEFQSFTIIASNYEPMKGQQTWCEQPLGWEEISGRLFLSLIIGIEQESQPSWSEQDLFRFADREALLGSRVSQGRSDVFADFRADPRGRTRYLVQNRHERSLRTGRLVQRLIELETYSALSLLALPRAKEIGPQLAKIDRQLRSLTDDMTTPECDDEQVLMTLTDLAADSERLSAATQFRLNASIAYARIVEERVDELGEERIEGHPRLGSFVKRRLIPAARTFKAVLNRQREQSERISRSTSLLRGRVEVTQNKQNQNLLASMNSRAEAQYRLQKTVEGLSTVAISYYALSILGYLFGGAVAAVPWLPDVKILVALAAPLVIFAVWATVRRIRRS